MVSRWFDEFILPGLIDFSGSVGAYGEESVVEQYTDAFIPDSLLTESVYRELMITASAGLYNNGDFDYINKYNATGIQQFEKYNNN